MRFVLQLGFSNYRNYTAIAQAAEAAGWDWLSIPDSLFFPRLTESEYPYAETSAIRQYLEHSDFIEPFVAMSTMAAVTQRMRTVGDRVPSKVPTGAAATRTVGDRNAKPVDAADAAVSYVGESAAAPVVAGFAVVARVT